MSLLSDEEARSPENGTDWRTGEHPDWWVSDSLIWVFTGAQSFATSDLRLAALRLFNETHEDLATVRGALMGTPRTAGDSAAVLGFAVEAHALFPFLRGQVPRLRQAEARLDLYRQATVGGLLDAMTRLISSQDSSLAPRALDPHDTHYWLGMTARELLDRARECKAHEVRQFITAHLKAEREQSRPSVAPDHGPTSRSAAQQRGIERFLRYFGYPDFEPETSHEAEALRLHRAAQEAGSAAEEEALIEARDAYLCAHVVSA